MMVLLVAWVFTSAPAVRPKPRGVGSGIEKLSRPYLDRRQFSQQRNPAVDIYGCNIDARQRQAGVHHHQ
jgi:hypothetical protein